MERLGKTRWTHCRPALQRPQSHCPCERALSGPAPARARAMTTWSGFRGAFEALQKARFTKPWCRPFSMLFQVWMSSPLDSPEKGILVATCLLSLFFASSATAATIDFRILCPIESCVPKVGEFHIGKERLDVALVAVVCHRHLGKGLELALRDLDVGVGLEEVVERGQRDFPELHRQLEVRLVGQRLRLW